MQRTSYSLLVTLSWLLAPPLYWVKRPQSPEAAENPPKPKTSPLL